MPLGPRRASGPPDQPGSVGPAQSFNDEPTSRRADVDELLGREAEPSSEVRQAAFRGAAGDPERGRRGADRAPVRDISGEGLALALGGPWFLPHDPLPVMRTSVRCATSPRAIRVTCPSNIAALPEGSGECLARENSWACGGENLDLERGTLTVRHTLQRGTRTLAEPKTERGRRTLHLPGEALGSLREHRREQLEIRIARGPRWADDDYVFTTGLGRPLAARSVLRSFHEHLNRAGLPSQRFHEMSHDYETLMLEDGEELGVISRTLGHSQVATTADIYAHLTPAMLERTAARMDGVLLRRKRAI